MLCHQCRRATTRAVRQLGSASRAQSTWAQAPVRATLRASRKAATPLASVLQARRQAVGAWSLKQYSTSSSETSSPTASSSPSPSTTPEKPDYLDAAESEIWDKLTAEFAPTELMVQDVSGGCGSMYGIEIASEKFRGTNMLKQQRMVNAVLGEQMKGWHGVQLRTKVPS
ncbi:hypothetical protein PFICI_12049 [Pestalotiopsis fici W106-1]|uniref:Bola-like protein n=1 Tax=Pestalotiopsis fici (strain W106-1 / CGMCC3.15140) TaxID=1229662 RepID=W3WU34_PESFW|nr:uncharacterized protein PFICI_12049 [Pestalotiopsis fici W106-1]ETS76662.1 hypothetical protein PFICI_12049 [Pestalotiopsis fici W106-1]